MKAMVMYDSVYGNTSQIGDAIGAAIGTALGSPQDIQAVKADDARLEQLAGLSLLVVGSATQKFNPLGATTRFLKAIPKNELEGIKVAAFDTRFPVSEVERVRILAFFVRIFGYAAEPIAKRLQKAGGELVVPAEGFYVSATKGPLLEGELERAADWGRQIVATL
ncbi:MAG TPA: nitric oxide synthase [Anaerolineae bacterium]|nr:nitric oxide synthase [Anaerolineae bacterium]